MLRQGLWALALPFASAVSAEGFAIDLPVDCILGDTCYIQQFMDRDPTDGVQDHQCRSLSYDGHKGTDFAVPTGADMAAGVDVIAAADGKVRGLRDGMPDTGLTPDTAAAIKGKECGNGVVLQHPGGWETQYCHLKQGSISVKTDQQVKTGDVLGQIGLSGRTEFPHMHLSVRKDGVHVDPFDPDGTVSCATPGDSTLWVDTPRYEPGGILDSGFLTKVPKYDAVKAGLPKPQKLPSDAPALVLFGFSFGTLKDDVLRLTIMGPAGEIISKDNVLPRNHAQAFRAVGKKRSSWSSWPVGQYTGTVTLMRQGKAISTQTQTVKVADP